MKHLIIIIVILIVLPTTSSATAIATSGMKFDWSTLDITYSNELSVNWETDPFSFGHDLILSDTITDGSIWREEHSPIFNFTAVGQGAIFVKIDFESYCEVRTDYADEFANVFHNHEMMLKSDSDTNFADYGYWYGVGLTGPFEKLDVHKGTLYTSIWVNDFDTGSLHLWLHEEMGAISTCLPVPEPATMALFGIGLLGLVGINRKKHV